MGRRRVTVIALGLLAALALAGAVWAQVSSQFDLSWHVIASAGGEKQSANYLVQDTLGQWVGDIFSCGRREAQAGFWYGVVLAPPPQCERFLPLTLRNFVPCFVGAGEVEPNNTYGDATGPLCSGRDYRGYPNDTNDYFSLYLQTTGSVHVALANHTGGNVQLVLYYQTPTTPCPNHQDPNYPTICARDFQGPFGIGFNATAAGWYYIRIYTGSHHNNTTQYTLQATYP